ncbi:putative cytosolic iron-sulfur protein assembly protein 1 [Fulvia fulva]|nr:putative cytosolic iron-sulfur protein assembly protein 1 [Fulvia fulva]KAK4611129.1 putative cytosolic iron-sulfur protein assembly protein 1 [Fulvia fulva]WPV21745.1 putative cytosolic iron-sulfur protein assembly protein 1 [Fulvia fulva]WPV36891.1 putative cytosolic iron-sulfur protein assembly protein 1 [Fulvia fulva]
MAPCTLKPLATFTPPCNSRTWMSTPHPHLPILATACSDKTVRIYSLQNFTQLSVISGGHKRSIRSCAWKPNSKGQSVLATGSFDASAGIWMRFEEGAGGGGIGGEGGEGMEVDVMKGLAGGDGEEGDDEEEWKLEVILDGHDSEIKSLQFCPTAPLLATCSRDKSVWIWEELENNEFETMAVLQDHEGDVKCVGWHPSEQLLASGSYDDCVRLWREDVDDWACCALITGHKGTVWWVEFEGEEVKGVLAKEEGLTDEQNAWLEEREQSGPRLMTASDDKTIRIWRRKPKEKPEAPTGQGRLPSIWKNNNFEEDWFEEARLPQVHEMPVYAVSWSKKTGRVVSTGSDGKIVVYEEQWRSSEAKDVEITDATPPPPENNGHTQQHAGLTEWAVVGVAENAHDVFEVNHVVWVPRFDKGKRFEGEEVVVSTGDDGEVKVWALDD